MTSHSANNSSLSVAVVGAGISGLTCAAKLQAAGVAVSVFDKGRRPGGRMSTRVVEDNFSFDHGCQYFTAKDADFRRQVASWADGGCIYEWPGKVVGIDNGRIAKTASSSIRYVGVPGMASVCSYLASGVNVQSNVDVKQACRIDEHWQLLDHTGTCLGKFDALILATPPPQAEKLMTLAPTLLLKIRRVQMSACWTVMMAFEKPIAADFDAAVVKNSSLSWIARNSSKPQRTDAAECWVGQASSEWSADRVEKPRDAVATELADEFGRLFKLTQQPVYLAGHRWKLALPTTPLSTDFLFDDTLNFGLCGDWCLGNRVESAWLSGTAVAKHLLANC